MTESKKPQKKDSTKDIDFGPKTVRLPPASERWEREPQSLGQTVKDPPSAPGTRPSPQPPALSEIPQSGEIGGIEMVVFEELQVPGGERRPWRAAEVWTKRRVYGLDSSFRCLEVVDRETGRPEPNHEMLGARLGGGRIRDKDTVRFSYPLPLPGMEAMFSKGKKHGYTSLVVRMIVRVRVLHTSANDVPPSWDDIASRWSDAPPRL